MTKARELGSPAPVVPRCARPGGRRFERGAARRPWVCRRGAQRLAAGEARRLGLVDDPLELGHPLVRQLSLGQRLGHSLRVGCGQVTAQGKEVALDRFEEIVEEIRGRRSPGPRRATNSARPHRHRPPPADGPSRPVHRRRGRCRLGRRCECRSSCVGYYRHGPLTSAAATTMFSLGCTMPQSTLPSRTLTCSIQRSSRG